MQGRIIEIPMVGNIEFPDSMTDDQVNAAAAKLYNDAKIKPVASHKPAQPPMPTVDDFGRDVLNEPKDSMDAAKPFIAPALSGIAGAMTGGGSGIAQVLASMGAQGAAGAAGSAIRGGSPLEMAGNAALDAGVSGIGSGVSALAKAAIKGAQPLQAATKAVWKSGPTPVMLMAATPEVPGPAAREMGKLLRSPAAALGGYAMGGSVLGGAVPYALGKAVQSYPSQINKGISATAQATGSTARQLPNLDQLVRALLMEKLNPQQVNK